MPSLNFLVKLQVLKTLKEKILKEEKSLKESMTGRKYTSLGQKNKQMNKPQDAWIAECPFVITAVH